MQFFRQILKKLFFWKAVDSRDNLSVLRAVSRVVKLDLLEDVVGRTADRRCLLTAIAEAAGLSQEELLIKVSRIMEIPYLEHVEPVDVSQLRGRIAISDLRQMGAVPLVNGGIIAGIVCANPALLGAKLDQMQQQPIFLASWAEIAKALDKSEGLVLAGKQQQGDADSLRRRLEQAVRDVLRIIFNEALSYQQSTINLSFAEHVIEYSFAIDDGRRAMGKIDQAIARPLLHLLEASLAEGGLSLELDSQQSPQIMDVKQLAERQFQIGMQSNSQAVPNRAQGAQEAKLLPFPKVTSEQVRDRSQQADREQEQQQDTKQGEAAPEIKEQCSTRNSLLLIDDNSTFMNVLQRFFERYQCQVHSADSGKAALELLSSRTVRPDVIVCDVHMPYMNGIEFIRQLKKLRGFEDTPVVILTSDHDIEMELKLVSLGASAFIGKNEDPRLLYAHVKRLLEDRAATSQKRNAA